MILMLFLLVSFCHHFLSTTSNIFFLVRNMLRPNRHFEMIEGQMTGSLLAAVLTLQMGSRDSCNANIHSGLCVFRVSSRKACMAMTWKQGEKQQLWPMAFHPLFPFYWLPHFLCLCTCVQDSLSYPA